RAENRTIRAQALLGLAQVELLRNDLTAAQESAEEALKLCEDLRTAAVRPDLQTSYLAEHVNVYHLLISILMEQHRDREAFERGEQTRARSLLDALREGREIQLASKAGVSTDLLNQFQAVRKEIDRLARQRDWPGSDRRAIERRLSSRFALKNE